MVKTWKFTGIFIVNDTQLVVADSIEEAIALYKEYADNNDKDNIRKIEQYSNSGFGAKSDLDYLALIKDENS